MKRFEYSQGKNEQLKKRHGISFENVIEALRKGKLLDTLDHPNKIQYPNQQIFIIELNEYVYSVPFVENEVKIFLKTIYPSRKHTKKYLKGGRHEDIKNK